MGKQSSVQIVDPIDQYVSGIVDEVNKETEVDRQRAKRAELDQRLVQLKDQMFKFADQYGIEDFRTQLMIQFHDVAMVMQDCLDLIQGVTTAMTYMFETIEFLDEMMNYQQNLMIGSLTTKYGLLTRIKERIRLKKTIKCALFQDR